MTSAALTVDRLSVGYRDIPVLHDVSLTVRQGECAALIGANGAGKTTLLRAVSGLLRPRSGRITYHEQDLRRVPAHRRARMGIMHLPEGRGVFRTLTVAENLRIFGAKPKDTDRVGEHFPALLARLDQPVALLSGGEQQMLALATTLLAEPSLLLIDELSFGLAPLITAQLGAFLKSRLAEGCSILLVEESLPLVLAIAEQVFVLQTGRIVHAATADAIREDQAEIAKAYLAVG